MPKQGRPLGIGRVAEPPPAAVPGPLEKFRPTQPSREVDAGQPGNGPTASIDDNGPTGARRDGGRFRPKAVRDVGGVAVIDELRTRPQPTWRGGGGGKRRGTRALASRTKKLMQADIGGVAQARRTRTARTALRGTFAGRAAKQPRLRKRWGVRAPGRRRHNPFAVSCVACASKVGLVFAAAKY